MAITRSQHRGNGNRRWKNDGEAFVSLPLSHVALIGKMVHGDEREQGKRDENRKRKTEHKNKKKERGAIENSMVPVGRSMASR